MSQEIVTFVTDQESFQCPWCSVYAHQTDGFCTWNVKGRGAPMVKELHLKQCAHCNKFSVWWDGKLVHPRRLPTPPPNPDLPDDVKRDYREAAEILQASPRGAAALLRLAIQKICVQLGEPGKDLNTDIGNLVKKGLDQRIQQALDVVRVAGNEAVHPGTLDLRDDTETATSLFGLVNIIADRLISQPKQIEELYSGLPANKLKGIQDRDRSGTAKS